ncbi:DUF982 domain-containing protein (plasmid) [Mesorhizobium sp. AR07]|uniref:DUF982 domain-containing protein n=1 Tax=Mesorhizobium sp. AR07 TaxID=2865838 RepID=UPI00215DE0C5|nr:DUF982 domain-containing protein [Mesorhizobium sp. AR07]UVK49465.1 DUF982 domain-containing protein [Mesorhizobium sp. AR07]
MQRQRFGKPVRVALGNSRRTTYSVQRVAQAAHILPIRWLSATSQKHVDARNACLGALERQKDEHFECFPEPSGGWVVWDNDADEPAMLSGTVLSGVSEREAYIIIDILNGFGGRSVNVDTLGSQRIFPVCNEPDGIVVSVARASTVESQLSITAVQQLYLGKSRAAGFSRQE